MNEIEKWMSGEADVREGLRLLSEYSPNEWLSRLVEAHPERYKGLLIRALGGQSRADAARYAARSSSLRKDWPFLSEPDCPMELKILAADKITAYREFARFHDRLYSCTTQEECAETAKKCVESFNQNCRINYEFSYYQENRKILGKHPIFAELRQTRELRSMDVLTLADKKRRLLAAIAKLETKIRRSGRPDLEADRMGLIQAKRRQLAEAESMIGNYRKAYGRESSEN